ncbi:PLD nuclease N-terminal domain-containing protein [Isoptericola sp. NEAU-Y5]|uniref:PLD nuclease N-terminal domain-containing protein n=1 Tax=Isoptericola luteus TaxID=2879484 RepID=A0ABS7ZMQ4_9MICO|nr:PLD nuclease N-terminal domain-containing protein [Isoptericola sp. NEAU-Y5]MCA5894939.1 PLD nuclease N-terminal domain-containing protein [Isoptericola sp. NEAU-Y5]
MFRALLMLAYLALIVYAIVDVVQADDDDTGGLAKGVWIVIILFLPFAGSVAWIVVSQSARQRRRSARGTGFPAGPTPPATYPGRRRTWETEPSPVTPHEGGTDDDDPELRWLLEQARLQREQAAREQTSAGPEPGTGTASPA